MEGTRVIIKRKRTQTSRRPRPEGQPPYDPSTPISDDASKVSSDENNGDGISGGKMFNLNQWVSRPESGSSNAILSNGISDGAGSENKLKKVKLKVGGVTRTIEAKSSSSNGASGSAHSPRPREMLIAPQANTVECHASSLDKKRGLQGIPWKDFSKGHFSIGKEDMGRGSRRNNNTSEKLGDNSDSVRKSKRPPKRRVLDADFDEDEEDDEIRFLEKLKSSKLTGYNMDLDSQPTRNLQKGGKYDNLEDVGRLGRKPISGDMDYEENDEPLDDGDPEGKKKKLMKDLSELTTENKRELALTTRQRALLTKDAVFPSGANQIEFPNGLPPAPSRRQKEKPTDLEQQMKRAEAAQRRKMQNEKAARESEAEAIRKILGQDSSRKKREEKIKRRQEELAQGKATSAEMLVSNTIRTVVGPTGTTVTFPLEMGLPEIFDPKPCSYPPPREKCVGPFCTKDYKYRDSRLRLPLCSLQCYKAINEKLHAGKAC